MKQPRSINANPDVQHPVFPGAERLRPLAVLMLDTRFARLPGDIGHPATWQAGARFVRMAGLIPRRVVAQAARQRSAQVPQAVLLNARQAVREGAGAITTSCGFLVLVQQALQQQLRVPVASSALLWLAPLLRQHSRVGVLTISAKNLGRAHLLAAGVPRQRLRDVVVQGLPPNSEFVRGILDNRPNMDWTLASAEVLDAALALKTRAPDLRALVLECTNMPPLQKAVQTATGWSVHSLLDWPDLARYRGDPMPR